MDLITVWNPQRNIYEMKSKSGRVCIETGKCMKTKQRENSEQSGAGVKIYQMTESDINRLKKNKNKNSKLASILSNAKAVSGSGLMIL